MWTTLDGNALAVMPTDVRRIVPQLKRERPLWRFILLNHTGSLAGTVGRLLRRLAESANYVRTRTMGARGDRSAQSIRAYVTEFGDRAYYLYALPGANGTDRLIALREQAPTAAEPEVTPGKKVPASVLSDGGMSGNRAQETVIAQIRRRIPPHCKVLEGKPQIRRNIHGEIVWAGRNIPDLQMICNGRIYAIEVDTKNWRSNQHKDVVPRTGVTSAFVKIDKKARIQDVSVHQGRSKKPVPRGEWGRLLGRVMPRSRRAREFEMEAESVRALPEPLVAV